VIRGVGVDLVSVERLRRILERTPRFRSRVFHPVEIRQAADRADRLAARFAAKEAWLKAMQLPLFSVALTEIWVETDDDGRPRLLTTGTAALLMESRGVKQIHLSLSHDDDRAIAMVVLEGDNR
jgi:holo-[acyl-carrier protein] synthase